uniref:Uncharacterized protein n=1 Tax=Fagus sylvatica TaxID=28930 RepID=A0A2N9EJF8_FAGSY
MAKNKSSCSSSACHSPPPLITATSVKTIMAKNKSSCSSSACHSPPPLITVTSGGGF